MWIAAGVFAVLGLGVAACALLSDASPPREDTAKLALPAAVSSSVTPDLGDLSKWEIAEGTWTKKAGEKGPILVQSSTDHTFNVILLREPSFKDVDVSVRF